MIVRHMCICATVAILTILPAVGNSADHLTTVGSSNLNQTDTSQGKTRVFHRKAVFLYGKQLANKITVTYGDGIAYINGMQWHPLPAILSTESSQMKAGPLSASHIAHLREIPFVARKLDEGIRPEVALQEFATAQAASAQNASRAYLANLSKGPTKAAAIARDAIDKDLAVVDASGKHAPKFSENGSVSLFCHGFGWFDYMVTSAPVEDPKPFDLAAARKDFKKLSAALTAETTSLVIYDRGGTLVYMGQDAERAFSEIDAMEREAGSPEAIVKSLHLVALPEQVAINILNGRRER